eukprot:CAMPEP_0174241962 /NCGR_PEP_ID=MMETSP0417-20130205/25794_1 /TAXON_ID=242541 /ORGANISM="Mayorella sp, Strain BSH-02190019" /LENGTH=387 /DNA_ID=CAMNT_0015321299 /DNA_START=37 /DNA_END=1200 /DNA_ORIENTATION=-
MACSSMCHYAFDMLYASFGHAPLFTDALADRLFPHASPVAITWKTKGDLRSTSSPTDRRKRKQSKKSVTASKVSDAAHQVQWTSISCNRKRSVADHIRRLAVESATKQPNQSKGNSLQESDLSSLLCRVQVLRNWRELTNGPQGAWQSGKHGLYLNCFRSSQEVTTTHTGVDASSSVCEPSKAALLLPGETSSTSISDALRELLHRVGAASFDSSTMKLYAFDVSFRECGWDDFVVAREELKAQVRAARQSTTSDGDRTHSSRGSPSTQSSAGETQGGWNTASIVVGLSVLAMFIGVLVLRFHEENYDVRVEDFLHNYDVLGVPRDSDMNVVKAAWRQLSRKWHPDKNPGCIDCQDKYMDLVRAHDQIKDFHRGKINLVRTPPPRAY